MINITIITCFYAVKSKHDHENYKKWISNFLSIVNNFYLVIYTDELSIKFIDSELLKNDKIKLIIKPFIDFYNYKYEKEWIENQKINIYLNNIDWKLNMIWSEKTYFVKEVIDKKIFDTEWYGWCDIGYFRGRNCDTVISELKEWPKKEKIECLNKNKIYYGLINNNQKVINNFIANISKLKSYKNRRGTILDIISGGFFLIYKDKINWWQNTYDERLKYYFDNNILIKDDQQIIFDCFAYNQNDFNLVTESYNKDNKDNKDKKYDMWFMFQRWLN